MGEQIEKKLQLGAMLEKAKNKLANKKVLLLSEQVDELRKEPVKTEPVKQVTKNLQAASNEKDLFDRQVSIVNDLMK